MDDQLIKIKQRIDQYYEMPFENEEADFDFNKKLKNEIKSYVEVNATDNERVYAAIKLLANNSGCSEDAQIAEDILNELFEKNIIGDEEISYFYANSSLRRWE